MTVAMKYTGEPWIVYEWPDGTWCNAEDLESYLEFMSDDFIKCQVLTYYPDYTPATTELCDG